MWMTETRSINDLVPAEYNPRQLMEKQKEALQASLDRFGQAQEIAINTDGTIIGGHQRIKILKELGYETVRVSIPDRPLTKEEEKELNVRFNQNIGEWDFAALSDNFELDELTDWGFDLDELSKQFDLLVTAEEKDDEVPEVPKEPIAKLGDLYKLGEHRLLCGDATKVEDVERLMDGQKADITFTSPPYNVGHNLGYKNKNDKYDGSGDNIENYDQFLTDWVLLALKYSRYVFNNIQMLANNKHDIIRHLAEVNNYVCDVAFWKKSQVAPAMAANVMNSQIEMIWILGKENKRSINTSEFRGTVANFIETSSAMKDNKNTKIHNATMPVALCDWVIKNFTQLKMSIIDVFGGTGTTLIAAEKLGRKCYMMELDPKYIDVIVKRWEDYTGSKAEKI